MKHFFRIVLEIFAPPLLGALGVYFWAPTGEPWWLTLPLPALQIHILYGYLYATVPSIVYAGAMELAFTMGLKPQSWVAVVLSGLLCAGAGYCTASYWGLDLGTFAPLGLIAGLIVGFCARLLGPVHKSEKQRGR